MSSPTLDTFCCMPSRIEPIILTHLQVRYLPYNIVCVISSLLGMAGAVYQILPSPPSALSRRRHSNIGHTQKSIINWLAMADFFATAGILLRSAFWIWKGDAIYQDNWDVVACAIFAIWVRFFYTATYMYTLCYAVDVYLVCIQKTGSQKCYHIVTWVAALLFTATGLGTLYLPDFRCHTGPWRVLPNYLLSYFPIVCVMIVNPILYYLSSRNVRTLLTGGLGQLTYIEHNLLAALKEKFFCIVLVFYVCWFPNILNGALLWAVWERLPARILLALWFGMAVVNPLQAILNSLVYKGWDGCHISCTDIKSFVCCRRQQERSDSGLLIENSDSEPHFTREIPSFSTNHS